MMKRGANRSRMEAKVFGGGAVIAGMNTMNVGERNTEFVLDYLKTERIPVVQGRDGHLPAQGRLPAASGKAMVTACSTNADPVFSWDARRHPKVQPAGRPAGRRPVLSWETNIPKTRVVVVDDSALVRPLHRDHQPPART